jgi:hypothetical protein
MEEECLVYELRAVEKGFGASLQVYEEGVK